jgi:hypothetical protein
MSKICEISLGSLQGKGILDMTIPTGETLYISSTWGLGYGFYLCVISAIILISAGLIDFIRRKNVLRKIFRKKK